MSSPTTHVKHDKRCGCGKLARQGQRNCLSCAAAANRKYRARKATAKDQAESLAIAGIAARLRSMRNTEQA